MSGPSPNQRRRSLASSHSTDHLLGPRTVSSSSSLSSSTDQLHHQQYAGLHSADSPAQVSPDSVDANAGQTSFEWQCYQLSQHGMPPAVLQSIIDDNSQLYQQMVAQGQQPAEASQHCQQRWHQQYMSYMQYVQLNHLQQRQLTSSTSSAVHQPLLGNGQRSVDLDDVQLQDSSSVADDSDGEQSPTSARPRNGHASSAPSGSSWAARISQALSLQRQQVDESDLLADEAERDAQAGTPSFWKQLLHKFGLCGCAVLMLWVSSLSVAKLMASSFVRSPALNDVTQQWSNTYTVTTEQQTAFISCMNTQADLCDEVFNLTLGYLLSDLQYRQAVNSNITAAAVSQQQQCDTSLNIVLGKISLYIKAGAVMQYDTGQCSATEVQQTQALVGDTSSLTIPPPPAATSPLISVNATNNVTALLAASNASIDANLAYNKQYLSNKTAALQVNLTAMYALPTVPDLQLPAWFATLNSSVQTLLSCITTTSSNSYCPQASVVAAYNTLQASVFTAYLGVQIALGQISNQFVLFSQNVVSIYQGVQPVWNVLQTGGSALYSAMASVGLSLPPLVDISGLNVLYSIPTDIQYALALPALQPPNWNDYINVYLPSMVPNLNNALTSVQQALHTAMLSMVQQMRQLTASIPTLFDDYHPPLVNLNTAAIASTYARDLNSQAASLYQQSQQQLTVYAESIRNATHRISAQYNDTFWRSAAANKTAQYNSSLTSYHVTSHVPSLSDLRSSFSSFSLVSLSAGAFDLGPLVTAFSQMTVVLAAVDIAWRAYKSVAVVFKFIRSPSSQLPVIDLRDNQQELHKPSNKFLYLITHPTIIIVVVLVLLGWALSFLILAYIPVYESYQQNCAESQTGTWVTNNTYSVAYNYASAPGYAVYGARQVVYTGQKTAVCVQNYALSTALQMQQQHEIDTAGAQQDSDTVKLQLIQKCMLNSSFSLLNITNTTGLDPQVRRLVSTNIQQCDRSPLQVQGNNTNASLQSTTSNSPQAGGNFTLINAIFNCSLLPSCSNNCPPPSSAAIYAVSFNAGCQSEYFVHASIQMVGLNLLVYLCLNISRLLLMRALSRQFWRQLCHDGFAIIASCDRRGLLDRQARKDLKRNINKHVSKFEASSLLLFVGAFAAHTPYILLLAMLTNLGGLWPQAGAKPPDYYDT